MRFDNSLLYQTGRTIKLKCDVLHEYDTLNLARMDCQVNFKLCNALHAIKVSFGKSGNIWISLASFDFQFVITCNI
jgi:hypothetical protein